MLLLGRDGAVAFFSGGGFAGIRGGGGGGGGFAGFDGALGHCVEREAGGVWF